MQTERVFLSSKDTSRPATVWTVKRAVSILCDVTSLPLSVLFTIAPESKKPILVSGLLLFVEGSFRLFGVCGD
jgi:hypothetical protein